MQSKSVLIEIFIQNNQAKQRKGQSSSWISQNGQLQFAMAGLISSKIK